MVGRLSKCYCCKGVRLLMDKAKQTQIRKLRKKAIKLQNSSPSKLTMAEAMRRAKTPDNV
jgi:hypothetical protein